MVFDEFANARHNMIRRHILTVVAKSYPRPVDSELLRATLATLGYPMEAHALEFYVSYLQEKECLKVETKMAYGITLITITARGIDAMDGRLRDCGIEC
ncbi:MAG: hypothetical protein ABSF90_10550 [Syntrophobacteraceae bacterium]|jgi:hypothetical protein